MIRMAQVVLSRESWIQQLAKVDVAKSPREMKARVAGFALLAQSRMVVLTAADWERNLSRESRCNGEKLALIPARGSMPMLLGPSSRMSRLLA